MKVFKYIACIHPKHGGDDYLVDLEVKAPTEAEANKYVEAHLRKQSAVVDYRRTDDSN